VWGDEEGGGGRGLALKTSKSQYYSENISYYLKSYYFHHLEPDCKIHM